VAEQHDQAEQAAHQDAFLQPAKSVAKSVADAAEAQLQAHIKEDVPSPGTEAVLRRLIDG
jgi:hypothetical protein